VATSKIKTDRFKYPVSNQFGNFFSDQPSTFYGIIENRGLDKTILEDFKKGISVKQLARKHRLAEGTVTKFVKSKIPKKEYEKLTKLKQSNFFDQSIVKDLKKDAKTMSRREVVDKYKGKVSDTKIDSLVKKGEIKFGVVEESGRPRVSEEMRDMDKVKRASGIKRNQRFNIHGNEAINFHHIMPIRGLANIQTRDVGLLNKYLNSELGGANQKLNDLAEEIGSLDMNKPGSIKKLDELNKISAKEVDKAKTKLPAKYKGMVGYVRYEPVFDSNGTVIELSQFREGLDNTGSKFSKGLPENIKDMSPERLKEYKTYVKTNADDLLKKTKDLSKASQLKVCQFLNSGGLPGDCAQAIKKNPKKAAEVLSEVPATDEKMKAVKNSAQKMIRLFRGEPLKSRTAESVKALAKRFNISEAEAGKRILEGQWYTPTPEMAGRYTDKLGKMKYVDVTPAEYLAMNKYTQRINKTNDLSGKLRYPVSEREAISIVPRRKLKQFEETGRMKSKRTIFGDVDTPMGTLKYDSVVGGFIDPADPTKLVDQAQIKTWAQDNPMPVRVGEEPLKVATNKSVLKNVGKTLATIGAPLPTALLDGYFINEQVKEGKGTAEIASNPLNWLGLATMSTLSDISGVSKPGKLNAALRLGLNPGTIRGISRFAGLPGLAVSTAMTAYDQYKKYQNEEGFIYNLFNKEEK